MLGEELFSAWWAEEKSLSNILLEFPESKLTALTRGQPGVQGINILI